MCRGLEVDAERDTDIIRIQIKLATSVGIGLFLTLIGLTYSEGLGLIVGATDTPLELAGCHPSQQDPETGLCPSSDKMRNGTMWIGIFCGGILTALLMIYRVVSPKLDSIDGGNPSVIAAGEEGTGAKRPPGP